MRPEWLTVIATLRAYVNKDEKMEGEVSRKVEGKAGCCEEAV